MKVFLFILSKCIGVIFDLLIKFLRRVATSTENDIDDQVVDILESNKVEIINFFLAWLDQLRHESEQM